MTFLSAAPNAINIAMHSAPEPHGLDVRAASVTNGEVLHIWTCAYRPDRLLDAQSQIPRGGPGDATLLLRLAPALTARMVSPLLRGIGGHYARIVLIPHDGRLLPDDAPPLADLQAAVRPARLLVEPHPGLAVAGSLQLLRPGDSFVVCWPADEPRTELDRAVARGLRWRGAWNRPDPDFASVPCGAQGEVVPAATVTTADG